MTVKFFNYAAYKNLPHENRKGDFQISLAISFGAPFKIGRKRAVVIQPFSFNAAETSTIFEIMNRSELRTADQCQNPRIFFD